MLGDPRLLLGNDFWNPEKRWVLWSPAKLDEYLQFDGSLNKDSLVFLLFFVQNSDIPEFAPSTYTYAEWRSFFLSIIESIYSENDGGVDRME